MKHYYYLAHDGGVFRITAKMRPCERSARDHWPAEEPHSEGETIQWCASWEITLGMLNKQTYIGSVPLKAPSGRSEGV